MSFGAATSVSRLDLSDKKSLSNLRRSYVTMAMLDIVTLLNALYGIRTVLLSRAKTHDLIFDCIRRRPLFVVAFLDALILENVLAARVLPGWRQCSLVCYTSIILIFPFLFTDLVVCMFNV